MTDWERAAMTRWEQCVQERDRLRASNVDLLAALEAVEKYLLPGGMLPLGSNLKLIHQIRAAVAKANGD